MKNEAKWPIGKTQSAIAFSLQNLMMVNLKSAARAFDENIISKYLKIATINFAEKNKIYKLCKIFLKLCNTIT